MEPPLDSLATAFSPDAADPRTALAAIARDLYGRGWMAGTAGNLSLRQPDGSYWVTASGKPKGGLGRQDFLRLAPGGEVLERGRADDRPSAETSIHAALYGLYPSARACFHVHTVASNLVARLAPAPGEVRLAPLEMLKGFGIREQEPDISIAVFPNHADVPAIAAEMAAAFRAAPPRLPAFLIRDHGLTVWADGAEPALRYLELLEFIFSFMVGARAAGIPY